MAWVKIAAFLFTPANLLLAVLLFTATTVGMATQVLMQQPWTGIRASPANNGTLVINAIDANSPASAKFTVGETLLGLQADGKVLAVSPLLNSYPPLSPATFAQQEAFYQQQETLFKALTQGTEARFVTTAGKTVTLIPAAQTPLSAIPWVFWLLCLVNLTAPLVGALVWAYRPYQKESLYLVLHGLFYYVFAVSGSVVIASEFCLRPDTLRQDLLLQVIGINFAAALIMVIFCYTPKPLVRGAWLFWLILGVTALSTANYHYQWSETPGHMFYMQYPILYMIVVSVITLQLRRLHHQPVERASLFALTVAFMLPNAIIIALHVIPILLGIPPVVGNIAALLLFDLMAVGLAVGILRYRLFDIEVWWFKSMLWVLGGCLVAALDLAIATLFHTPDRFALAISIILAGFLYFPLRQWLLNKIIPLERLSVQDYLPGFSAKMSDAISKESFEEHWKSFLLQHFSPLHMESRMEQIDTSRLSDNGLHLYVPSLGNQHSYRLSGKQRAARLFNKKDVKNTESLLMIARMASNASETRQRAVVEERQRIMGDLHDSVGAQLMTLMHKLPDPEHKQAARLTLMTLRDTIRLSQKTCPLKLVDHVADWRTEIMERTEAAGVELIWQQGELSGYQLSAKQVLELTQVIREAVSNALKHAQPEVLEMGISVKDGKLHVCVMNDGRVSLPSTWQAGTGLNSMKKRIHGVNGNIQFRLTTLPKTKMQVLLSVPFLNHS
ncbi:sensor histidine kinase [Thiothrix nivea]|uniref:Putative signal transduction histidine kinase n=1 Tax=Thiothrix nivea (strain ATCC 35100 / DSM 5205 / JP2) TaxID=870187 RepID=A0A656HA33_THINJ|nr:hypothetical protein [Thiothrix nivea]EIJ33087.1 putative signal transduction histidine kinase [Thiothrix nivea DSM 5205]